MQAPFKLLSLVQRQTKQAARHGPSNILKSVVMSKVQHRVVVEDLSCCLGDVKPARYASRGRLVLPMPACSTASPRLQGQQQSYLGHSAGMHGSATHCNIAMSCNAARELLG